jgi:hypothetical protein
MRLAEQSNSNPKDRNFIHLLSKTGIVQIVVQIGLLVQDIFPLCRAPPLLQKLIQQKIIRPVYRAGGDVWHSSYHWRYAELLAGDAD